MTRVNRYNLIASWKKPGAYAIQQLPPQSSCCHVTPRISATKPGNGKVETAVNHPPIEHVTFFSEGWFEELHAKLPPGFFWTFVVSFFWFCWPRSLPGLKCGPCHVEKDPVCTSFNVLVLAGRHRIWSLCTRMCCMCCKFADLIGSHSIHSAVCFMAECYHLVTNLLQNFASDLFEFVNPSEGRPPPPRQPRVGKWVFDGRMRPS